MANELKFTAVSSYSDANGLDLPAMGVTDLEVTVTTLSVSKEATVSVGTSEEAIALGEVTAAKALCTIHNLDDTNYVEVRTATGASNDAIYIGPLEAAIFRFGTDVTAPYIVANTAACLVHYRLNSF